MPTMDSLAWDNPNSSRYAPRVVTRNGVTYLTEHGNTRVLQPNEVADATKYQQEFWAANPTGFQPGVGPQSNAEYYGQDAAQAGDTSRPTPTGGANLAWAGFNTGRQQDITKSAKDAFLYYGSRATWMPQSKEDAEKWFNEWIAPNLTGQGYKVYDVQGDRALVGTRENPGGEWVDFLIGAGGGNAQLGWQSNMSGQNTSAAWNAANPTTPTTTPTAGVGGAPLGPTTTPVPGTVGNGSAMADLVYQWNPLTKQYEPRQQVINTVTP